MSRKYKATNEGAVYFITCTITNWIDLFIRESYKEVLTSSLKYCTEHKGLNLHAYVIMTSHIHALVSSEEGKELGNALRDFKTHTSKALIKAIGLENESRAEWMLDKFQYEAGRSKRTSDFKVWQDGYHGIEILNDDMLHQKLDYIHNNPVVEGIVGHPEHYLYSSASNYQEGRGMLEVNFVV